MASFDEMLKDGYGFTDPAITLGAALEGATVHQGPKVRVPLAVLNRHGLIAGATGTGKTMTLQLMAEQMSAQGIPVFAADIKGDLSGIAVPGAADDRVTARAKEIGYAWKPGGSPVEFVSLSGKLGVQLRATVSSFALPFASCTASSRPSASYRILVTAAPSPVSGWVCSTTWLLALYL